MTDEAASPDDGGAQRLAIDPEALQQAVANVTRRGMDPEALRQAVANVTRRGMDPEALQQAVANVTRRGMDPEALQRAVANVTRRGMDPEALQQTIRNAFSNTAVRFAAPETLSAATMELLEEVEQSTEGFTPDEWESLTQGIGVALSDLDTDNLIAQDSKTADLVGEVGQQIEAVPEKRSKVNAVARQLVLAYICVLIDRSVPNREQLYRLVIALTHVLRDLVS